jgi:hypothetical protein
MEALCAPGGNGRSLPGIRRAIRARLAVVYEEVVIIDTSAVVLSDWTPIASPANRWGLS